MNRNRIAALREAARYNRRAFALWWRLAPQTFLSTAASGAVSAGTPYIGMYFTARLIDELAGGRDPAVLLRLALALLLASAAAGLAGALTSRWKEAVHATDAEVAAKNYFEKLLHMDFCDVDDPETHGLYTLIRQNANWSGWGMPRVQEQFENLITAFTQITGSVALSVGLFTSRVRPDSGFAWLNHPMSLAVMLLILLTAAVLSPALYNRGQAYWAKNGETARLSNRIFSFYTYAAIRERGRGLDVRTYRQDRLFQRKYEETIDTGFTDKSQMAKYAWGPLGLYRAASEAVSRLFTGCVYLFACLKAYGGAFGVGAVTQYIAAVTSLANGVAKCLQTLGDMRNNAEYLRPVFQFLDIPNKMYMGSLTTEKRTDRRYSIVFEDVSFRYPGSDAYALRHVNMAFSVGSRLAVVGRNGSGKTTFIKLLCRLYDPTEGRILLNGIDIRKYRYDEYLDLFSVVFQDFKLLALPLGQNVAAAVRYDRERAARCLELAGFGGRLERMPEGLDTCLYKDFDKGGVEISGGEAQKIALARVLYQDAPFIVLDEPTAALDPVAEAEVYSSFNRILGDKTAVYISHRLSSCRFCDEILVFDGGAIVQQGTHDALAAETEGLYCRLWRAQAQYYEGEAE